MKKIKEKIKKTQKKINSIDFDAHWYRRVFHTFGATFLLYYMLPDADWINLLKILIPLLIIVFAIILEILRLKNKVSSEHFFGLRFYEKNRVGSYLFFGVAILILLMFFPQQIAIPCILCACIADPIMGESRIRLGEKWTYLIGFIICSFFFIVTWYRADFWILIAVTFIGTTGALFGEVKKLWWIDDDFMIQILPAILLLLLYLVLNYYGLDILPEKVIYPGRMPW